MKKLGALLREKRESQELMIAHIATVCNVSLTYICKIEKGYDVPNVKCLEKWASVLQLDLTLLSLMAYLEKLEEYETKLKKKYLS